MQHAVQCHDLASTVAKNCPDLDILRPQIDQVLEPSMGGSRLADLAYNAMENQPATTHLHTHTHTDIFVLIEIETVGPS